MRADGVEPVRTPGSVAAARLHVALRCALVLLLGAALAACGNLPRPFQPAEKSTQTWAGTHGGPWGSILVRPIEGLPAPLSELVVDGIVDALHAQEMPASDRFAGRSSMTLTGHIAAASGKLRWKLVAPGGETVLRFEEPRPDRAWRHVPVPDLASIAARAAGRVAAALRPPAQASAAQATVPVVLDAIEGAPGDGGSALARAMRDSLARVGIALADDADERTLSIQGRVSAEPAGAEARGAAVTIAWTVVRPDGTRVGTVTQANRVPAERLTGSWGRLAEDVAQAGAPGIAQLITHAARSGVAVAQREAPIARSASVEAPIARPVAVAARNAPSGAVAAPIAPSTATRGWIAPPEPVEAPIAPMTMAEARLAPSTAPGAPLAVSVTVR